MRPSVFPLCWMCASWKPGYQDELDINRCDAFPDGIPDEILRAGFDHRSPLGSETILFTPAEGVTPEDIQEWEEQVAEVSMDVARAQMGIPREDFDAEDDED